MPEASRYYYHTDQINFESEIDLKDGKAISSPVNTNVQRIMDCESEFSYEDEQEDS